MIGLPPLYPNVPVFPGVPPVLRVGGAPDDAPAPMMADAPEVAAAASLAWGIYDGQGTIVLQPDSVNTLEFQREFRVEDYPLEQGAFETYNKVALPYEARVTMTKGGSVEDRKQFLGTVDALSFDTNLYSLVTPEETYLNANLTHYTYSRSVSNGAGLITVELTVQEVRITTAPQFSNSKSPSGADAVNDGSVQPTTWQEDTSIAGDGSDLGIAPQ